MVRNFRNVTWFIVASIFFTLLIGSYLVGVRLKGPSATFILVTQAIILTAGVFALATLSRAVAWVGDQAIGFLFSLGSWVVLAVRIVAPVVCCTTIYLMSVVWPVATAELLLGHARPISPVLDTNHSSRDVMSLVGGSESKTLYAVRRERLNIPEDLKRLAGAMLRVMQKDPGCPRNLGTDYDRSVFDDQAARLHTTASRIAREKPELATAIFARAEKMTATFNYLLSDRPLSTINEYASRTLTCFHPALKARRRILFEGFAQVAHGAISKYLDAHLEEYLTDNPNLPSWESAIVSAKQTEIVDLVRTEWRKRNKEFLMQLDKTTPIPSEVKWAEPQQYSQGLDTTTRYLFGVVDESDLESWAFFEGLFKAIIPLDVNRESFGIVSEPYHNIGTRRLTISYERSDRTVALRLSFVEGAVILTFAILAWFVSGVFLRVSPPAPRS